MSRTLRSSLVRLVKRMLAEGPTIYYIMLVSKPVMRGKIGNGIINIEMREPHRPEAEINLTIHMSSKLGEIVLFPTISHVPAKLSMSCYGTKSCYFTSGNTSLI